MNKESIDHLISWLEEIQEGKEPLVPYNLHPLVRLFHDSMGTTRAIELLKQLKEYKP